MNSSTLHSKASRSIEAIPYGRVTAAVMTRIHQRRISRMRTSAILHGGIIIAAIVSIVPAVEYALKSASQSGFSAYVSLVLSDGASLTAYWREFALTIIESAPLMAGAIVLAILVVLAYAARKMAGDISRMRMAI